MSRKHQNNTLPIKRNYYNTNREKGKILRTNFADNGSI